MHEASRNSEVDVRCMVDVRYWEKSSTISILERVCAQDAKTSAGTFLRMRV